MFVRSVRFVLLLLLVVAAFGASAVRAHAAAEVRNEESSTSSSQSESNSQVSVQQTVVEEHTTQTSDSVLSQGGTDGGGLQTKPEELVNQSNHIVEPTQQAALVNSDIVEMKETSSKVAAKQHTYYSANKHVVLAAESHTTPVQLQPTPTTQTTPQPNAPVSNSTNPLMVLLSATSNAIFTISGSLLQMLNAVVPLSTSYMLVGLVLTSLMVLLLASVVVTYLKRMGFAHGARSNPVAQATIILFAKSSSKWFTKQDSVFSYLVSNKIMKLHNVGGIL